MALNSALSLSQCGAGPATDVTRLPVHSEERHSGGGRGRSSCASLSPLVPAGLSPSCCLRTCSGPFVPQQTFSTSPEGKCHAHEPLDPSSMNLHGISTVQGRKASGKFPSYIRHILGAPTSAFSFHVLLLGRHFLHLEHPHHGEPWLAHSPCSINILDSYISLINYRVVVATRWNECVLYTRVVLTPRCEIPLASSLMPSLNSLLEVFFSPD